MSEGKKGIPIWVWLALAAPIALVAFGKLAAPRHPAVDAAPPHSATPTSQTPASALLSGNAVDLSTVMGRARKLADGWQREAALLGIEATLVDGKIQTQDGATAKLTFGPSPFDTRQTRSGLFVVVYDKSGITGAPAPGAVGKALPEPMCAPERVFSRLTHVGEGPIRLRYGFDEAGRPLWMANSQSHPQELRLFDAQDCSVHGLVGPRNKR